MCFLKPTKTKSPVLFLFTLDSRLGCGLDWTGTGLDWTRPGANWHQSQPLLQFFEIKIILRPEKKRSKRENWNLFQESRYLGL